MKMIRLMSLGIVFLCGMMGLILQDTVAADVEIAGSAEFTNQVTHALDLLKSKAPNAYFIVTNYVRRIEQGQHSGMWAYKLPPTYEMRDKTTFYSVTWCAATIAHDSFHSKLYHDYKKAHGLPVPDAIWIGVEVEKKCLTHQLEVMKSIGAPEHEIEHARILQETGTYGDVDHNGKYDWQDYKKREW